MSRKHAWIGPDQPSPTKDRRIDSRTVECLDCKAGLGERCIVVATGAPRKTPHSSRRRLAVRLLWEAGAWDEQAD